MAKEIEARIRQKVGTLEEWNNNSMILLGGEQAVVLNGNGLPVNIKYGDGTKRFSDLPFWIKYDQGAYSKVSTTVLPASDGAIHYSIVGSGTYTQAAGGSVVVPNGSLGIISNNGTTWSLDQNIVLPQSDVVDGFDSASTTEAGSANNDKILNDNKAGVSTETIIIDRGNIKAFPNPLNSMLMRADGTTAESETMTYSLPMAGIAGDLITLSYPARYITAFINGVASLKDGTGQAGSYDPSSSTSTYTFRPNVTSIIITVVKSAATNLVVNSKRTERTKTLDTDVNIDPVKIIEATNGLYRPVDELISISDTDFAEEINGDFYFVRNAVSFANPVGQGAMNADGVVGAAGTYAHTNRMSATAGQRIEFNQANRYVTAFVNGVSVRALGAGMSGTLDPSTDIRVYTVPPTVTEIVASPQLAQVATFQVNVYQSDKLQKFKNPAPNDNVSVNAIQTLTSKNQIRSDDVSISPVLYGISGSQISVYSDSTIKYWRDYRGYCDVNLNTTHVKLDRVSQAVLSSNVANNKIRLANEYFEITKEVDFSIISSNISNTTAKNVMLIGSSTTAQGYFLDYILESTAKTGLTFVGTKKTYNAVIPNRVNSEGRAGRTLDFYMRLQKGTTDHNPFVQPSGVYKYYGVTGFWSIVKGGVTSGSQYLGYGDYIGRFGTNGYLITPSLNDVMYDNSVAQFKLWNGTAWINILEGNLGFSFNIPKYLSTWSISAPDITHILLGSNDFMNLSEPESLLAWTAYKNSLDVLISSFKSANANVKIILGIPFSSGQQGDYGVFDQERRKRSNWIFSSKTIESYKDSQSNGIYIADYNAVVDRQNAYLDTNIAPYVDYNGVNTVKYIADPVHLSNNGAKYQLGISFAGIIQYLRGV